MGLTSESVERGVCVRKIEKEMEGERKKGAFTCNNDKVEAINLRWRDVMFIQCSVYKILKQPRE